MPLPQFIVRRGNQLYYRRAFPKALWPVTRNAFAMSLRTADPQEALKARPEAERRYTAKVNEARLKLAKQDAEAPPPLTKRDAEALATQWFLAELASRDEWRAAQPPDNIEEALEAAQEQAAEARRELAERDLSWEPARRLRDAAGFAPEPSADRALVRLLGRAAVAVSEVEAGRLVGRYGTRPADPFFASAMEAPAAATAPPQGQHRETTRAATGRTVEDLVEAFKAARFSRLTQASQLAYEPVFRLLRSVIGADTALARIGHAEGQKLFEAVQGIPANANKRKALRGLPLAEQIAEGKRLGFPTLAAKTINEGYMGNLGTLFRFANQRGWMNVLPTAGLRALDELADADRRDAFTPAQLRALFGAAPWTPQDATGGGSAVRYWGPLLALFHGLRRAEVVGLQVADIGEEQGQLVIAVRAGERRVKTRSARRDVPLHPELVRLGFAAFVEGRRAGDGAILFPGEQANSRGQWGRKLGEWFSGRVRELGLKGRKLTYHALRHNFRDALREAEIEASLADYLMGHATPGVAATYGSGRPSLGRLRAAMEKVSYPGLALPAARDEHIRSPQETSGLLRASSCGSHGEGT